MKTRLLIMLMCFMASMTFTSLHSQTKSDYAGKFVYEAEHGASYTLVLNETTKGKYEGELVYDFSVFGYKLSLTAEISNDDLFVYYGKTLSGMFNQKSEFNKKGKVLMFKLVILSDGECVTWARALEMSGKDDDYSDPSKGEMNDGKNFVKVD